MIQVEASDLKSAILEASKRLFCNYNDVDYYVLQEPLNGIFGVGRKNAIIVASIKVTRDFSSEKDFVENSKKGETIVKSVLDKKDTLLKKLSQKIGYIEDKDEKMRNDLLVAEIKSEILRLLKNTCFKIDTVAVSLLNKETLFLFFDGKDAPLLIGREGYRYKAISYVLQSWLSSKYNLKLQLEIGEFIKKQNEHVDKYLKDEVFEEVEKNGFFKTKILDEVLVKLAIKRLRDKYKDKYVKVRNTQDGGKFIVIDEFFTKKS
jgi:spoIIIJ-associated protein